LVGILISFPIGLFVGGVSGYFGGWLDAILMRFVEVLMTIPGIYLLVALAGRFTRRINQHPALFINRPDYFFYQLVGITRVIRRSSFIPERTGIYSGR
jgi:peptide/nickel transport system permease protein